MTKEKIARINELSRKSREQELTDEEKAEQQALRDEYRADFRRSLEGQVDRIYFKNSDGSIEKAKKN